MMSDPQLPFKRRSHKPSEGSHKNGKDTGNAGINGHAPDVSPTEDSVALEFERRFSGRLLFDHDVGSWFEWTGQQWKREGTMLAYDWVRSTARALADRAAKASTRAIALKSSFSSGVEKFARSTRAFATTSEGWNLDDFLMGTPSGTVDLRTGVLRCPNPADRITKIAAVAPASDAICPLWLKFLDEATKGNQPLVRFLQQVCGYSLTGDTREHALFFLHGPGGNGKSVLLKVLSGILGQYATAAGMDTFTSSSSTKHPTELASLHGARLVTSSETEEGKSWAEARIKQLTGGDRISARFMRQDFFEFEPRFKLFIVGNHRPTLQNVDEALRRRLNFIPFEHKPPKEDRQLEDKLQAEWSGILRWMIDGCLDWQRNGLVRPPAVMAATDRYFEDQDLLGQWLDEECETEPGNPHKWERSKDLFASWKTYVENAGEKVPNQKSLTEALGKRGFENRKGAKGVRTIRGIQLKRQPGDHHGEA